MASDHPVALATPMAGGQSRSPVANGPPGRARRHWPSRGRRCPRRGGWPSLPGTPGSLLTGTPRPARSRSGVVLRPRRGGRCPWADVPSSGARGFAPCTRGLRHGGRAGALEAERSFAQAGSSTATQRSRGWATVLGREPDRHARRGHRRRPASPRTARPTPTVRARRTRHLSRRPAPPRGRSRTGEQVRPRGLQCRAGRDQTTESGIGAGRAAMRRPPRPTTKFAHRLERKRNQRSRRISTRRCSGTMA